MVKIINSPSKYIQGKNEITNLATYYKLRGNSGAYLLVDKFIFDNFKDKIVESFKNEGINYHIEVFGGECSKIEINRNIDILKEKNVMQYLELVGEKLLMQQKQYHIMKIFLYLSYLQLLQLMHHAAHCQ